MVHVCVSRWYMHGFAYIGGYEWRWHASGSMGVLVRACTQAGRSGPCSNSESVVEENVITDGDDLTT